MPTKSFSVSRSLVIFLFLGSYIGVYDVTGHFCPALSNAVKTMKKGEKVILTVKPQCKLLQIVFVNGGCDPFCYL